MADGFVTVDPDSTGKKIDMSELTVGANTVERQRYVLADDADAAALAKITNGAPAGGDYGLVVRQAGSAAVTGPLTDAQLRAVAVPISAAALPLPTGASTEATLALIKAKTDNLDVLLSTRTKPADTQAVSGTFWQATQPVSAASLPLPTGASTEATLATRLSESDFDTKVGSLTEAAPGTDTASSGLNGRLQRIAQRLTSLIALLPTSLGQKTMANSLAVTIASDQGRPLFKGRSATFRTPGRAGTAGQKILTIHNAAGSAVTVDVMKITVDLMQTVVKAITVAPPVVKIWKFTAAPTNGTALTKNKAGGSTTSNASVIVTGDASADGTGSGTTLTVTLPAGTFVATEFAPRFITGAGYEMADRMEFFVEGGGEFELVAGEGLCVFLDYTLATQNPTTDMWLAGVEWRER